MGASYWLQFLLPALALVGLLILVVTLAPDPDAYVERDPAPSMSGSRGRRRGSRRRSRR